MVKIEQLLQELDQDPDLVVEVINLFLEASPQHRKNLKTAFEGGDWGSLVELAHTLKGTLSNFGPSELSDRAHELMDLARTEDYMVVREKLFMFQRLLEKFEQELNEIKSELQTEKA